MELNGGLKFITGDFRKNSLEEERNSPVLVNGEVETVEVGDSDEGSKSPTDKTVKEAHLPADRIKRKAKRLTGGLSKEAPPALGVSRFLKNSRKPRNGFGRGLPKKGTIYFFLKNTCNITLQ